ncbi:MAG: M14 family metallopeptidase [Actinomycetota bacterium]|nr:M14 family metallopeptidase [Actinomycetota bacterium]
MRKLTVIVLALALLAAFVPTGRTDTAAPAVVRVHVETATQAAYLMGHFDETHNHGDGKIELLLWPGDRAELDALGLEYTVVTENLAADDAAASSATPTRVVELPGPDRDTYRRLVDYNAEMEALAKKNPSLVKMFEMPRPSLEGRPIFGIEIAADVKRQDGRPVFYLDGVHHAREWPASEYSMIFAHSLVERFGKDPKVTSILNTSRVIIVPIVNVDGFDYSRESLAQNSLLGAGNGFEGYWRKNRRSFTGVTVPEAQKNPDAYGVDPNRNYAYLWGDQNGGSSGIIFDQTYRGEAPFSEPETQNVRDLVLGRPVTGVITNHTYQGSVLRAGGGDAPEDALLTRIGERMAKVLGFRNAPTVGYPTTGTTDDWAYAAIGSLGYTIEHGKIGFHPPYASEVGEYHDEAVKAFTIMAGVAADPRYHSVISGRVVPGPAKLMLTKTFKTPLSEGNPTGKDFVIERVRIPLTTAPDGSFELHVGPSDRPWGSPSDVYVLVIKAAGATKSVKIDVDRGQHVNLGSIRL